MPKGRNVDKTEVSAAFNLPFDQILTKMYSCLKNLTKCKHLDDFSIRNQNRVYKS